jgi:M6 family metalloprotease-like protein
MSISVSFLKPFASIVVCCSLILSLISLGTSAEASPKSYKNCIELNKDFRFGVSAKARPKNLGAKAIHTPVVNLAVFNKNRKLDTDRDSIVCEVVRKVTSPLIDAPKPEILPARSAEDCKLRFATPFETGFGFPRSSTRLPATGVIRAIVLFVEFPDALGNDDPLVEGKKYTEEFIKFYSAMSYGKLEFKVDVAPKYFKLKSTTSSYKMNIGRGDDGSGVSRYFQDALEAADPSIDFSPYEVAYVIPSSTNVEITYGPAFPLPADSNLLRTNEKAFTSGAVGGADSRLRLNSLEWVWMAHETGHLFGLEHPWLVQSDSQGRTTIGDTVAMWDMMLAMWNGFSSFEFIAWTRFLIGWIPDNQIACIDAKAESGKTFEIDVEPIARQASGRKMIFVKTSETTGIAIEVRRNEGFDRVSAEHEGTLVYAVDVSKRGNEGMARWLGSNNSKRRNVSVATIKTGAIIQTDWAQITVLSQGPNGDRIRIQVK